MNEHLERALIEVYYAMAEFSQSQARAQNVEPMDDTRARLITVKANLERLLLLPGQAVETRRTA